MNLRCSDDLLSTGKRILRITYVGHYPPGSEGNHVARAMITYATEAYARHHPDAILFDMTGLDYVWGDAICGIAVELLRLTKPHTFPFPACVLAEGSTHKALKPLFEPRMAFGVVGMRLFSSDEDALAYLKA